MRRRLTLTRMTLALALVAAASIVALPGTAQASKATPTYYVSLGDSYSVGYQPGLGATAGYTAYVAAKTHLTLVNFGCAGATTTSILDTVGCPDVLPHTAGAAVLHHDAPGGGGGGLHHRPLRAHRPHHRLHRG